VRQEASMFVRGAKTSAKTLTAAVPRFQFRKSTFHFQIVSQCLDKRLQGNVKEMALIE
jgi:hypothetical protein